MKMLSLILLLTIELYATAALARAQIRSQSVDSASVYFSCQDNRGKKILVAGQDFQGDIADSAEYVRYQGQKFQVSLVGMEKSKMTLMATDLDSTDELTAVLNKKPSSAKNSPRTATLNLRRANGETEELTFQRCTEGL